MRTTASEFGWSLRLRTFGLSIAAACCFLSPSAAEEPPLKHASVTGIVVDESGAPAAGVEVKRLYRDLPAATRTDASGKFTIEVPIEARSTRTLVARNESTEQQGYFRFGDGPIAADASPRIILRKSRLMEIRVLSADERPIAGAAVVISSSYWPIDEGATDEHGKVALQVPADAPLDAVYAFKPDVGLDYLLYRPAGEPANDPYRLPQDYNQPVALTLTGTRTITVQVVDDAGQALPSATVYPIYIECPNRGGHFQIGMFSQATDDAGRAVFRVIPVNNTATISFRAKLPGYDVRDRWEFDPAQRTNEITGTLVRLVPLRGRVTDSRGQPAAGANLSVAGRGYQSEGFVGKATSQPDGKFEILVKPDQYYLAAASHERSASQVKSLVIRAGQPPQAIELTLQPATRIHGLLTSSDSGKPLANRFVWLRYDDELKYHQLPEDQRLANPLDDRSAISPSLSQSTRSGPQGEFEFFAGPGRYILAGPDSRKSAKVESTGQDELEVNLQAAELELASFAGRVVSAADPSLGVAEATVTAWSTQPTSLRRLTAVSDAEGKFQLQRHRVETFLHAKTSNGLLAGMVKIKADAREAMIPIGPLAAAQGRLVDQESGLPLPGRQLEYAFRIVMEGGGWTWQFGGKTTTDARGEFTVEGLIPGFPFDLSVLVDMGADGRPRSWQTVSSVTAVKAELMKLGDVKLPPPYREPTLAERIAKSMPTEPGPEERLKRKLRDAKLGDQRLLVLAMEQESAPSREFFSLYYGENPAKPDTAFLEAFGHFTLLAIDTSTGDRRNAARPLLERLKAPAPATGSATFAILGPSGEVIAIKPSDELSADGKLSREKLVDFLLKHVPPIPDAEQRLAGALAEARRTSRRVLVQHSGPYCAPCVALSRFLDEHAALIAKDYVYVKLEDRFSNGEEVISRFRPDKKGGIPWFVMLDADGKPLITSDGPDGNIGFPSDAAGVAHFEKMVRATAEKLTDREIQSLLKALAPGQP